MKIIIIALLLSGCSSATNIDRLERQVDALQYRIDNLEHQMSITHNLSKESVAQSEYARSAVDKMSEDISNIKTKIFEH
jgi:outer membrane murein-binding lipoprotein Lpp